MLDRNWAPLQGLRIGDWKFVDAPDPELYDLKNDPSESQNVIAKFPERRDRMRETLRALIGKESPPASAAAPQDARDEETRKKLMSLGYLAGKASGTPKERPDPKKMIDLDNLFNDAIIASETGDLGKAERLYRDVLARQPDFIVGYEYAAYNLYKMGRLEDAVVLLKNAISANLTTVSLISRLGLYEQETGSLDESIRTLEKALGMDANYAEAYNYLGVSYFKSGRAKDASAMFQKAIALDPDYAMAMNNLGNCWLSLEDYNAAARTYEKAISTDSGLASAQNGLGAALYRKGQITDAVARWETSLELDPKQPDTLYNLGRAFLRLDRKKEALKLFEAFVAVAPPQKYQKDIDEVRGVIERLKKEIGEREADGRK
jgi:tetratricopeptide (TPR) repeat protein